MDARVTMIDVLERPSSTARIGWYVYLGTLYCIGAGVLYLWGYWARFNVNILEYMTVGDVVRAAAYPLTRMFVFAVVGMVLGELMFGGALPPGGGRGTLVGKSLHKIAPVLLLVYLVTTLVLVFYGPVTKWYVLPLLLSAPAYIVAKDRGFLVAAIPHESARTVAIYALVTLPAFAYGQGRLVAARIADGSEYDYVLSAVDGISAGEPTVGRGLRLLGHGGDFYFLLDPVEQTVVIGRTEDMATLRIKRFVRGRERSATGARPGGGWTAPAPDSNRRRGN
jgi:hypothetical protein